ncbi:hypothetical protein SDC9_61893 [bioreactor metagenome]|uniref:Uncharacterized protein n=2 Tax=root TaxID=1 RepID=A0A644XH32_9ZZZZ
METLLTGSILRNTMYYNKEGGEKMTISLRLNDADSILFKKYAEMNGITISELVRQSVLERIEDEYDLKAYEKAMSAYKANPATYSLDEAERELGLQ